MLTKIPKTIPVSDLRKNLAGYLRQAKDKPIIISASRGGDSRVIVTAETYNKLIEAYENRADAETLTHLVTQDTGKKRILWKNLKIKTPHYAV